MDLQTYSNEPTNWFLFNKKLSFSHIFAGTEMKDGKKLFDEPTSW